MHHAVVIVFFFFNDTATTEIYTLSLHDALPITAATAASFDVCVSPPNYPTASTYPVMGPTGRGAAAGVTCAHGLAGARQALHGGGLRGGGGGGPPPPAPPAGHVGAARAAPRGG